MRGDRGEGGQNKIIEVLKSGRIEYPRNTNFVNLLIQDVATLPQCPSDLKDIGGGTLRRSLSKL